MKKLGREKTQGKEKEETGDEKPKEKLGTRKSQAERLKKLGEN
jgi:hypothetical protein